MPTKAILGTLEESSSSGPFMEADGEGTGEPPSSAQVGRQGSCHVGR